MAFNRDMSWELYWRFRISPLGFLVAWERGFSAQTFWNQRKRVNKQLKGADSSLKRIGSRVFCLIFHTNLNPGYHPPTPPAFGWGCTKKATNHGLRLRATVLDRFRMEITTSKEEFFQADASGGHLVLSIKGRGR